MSTLHMRTLQLKSFRSILAPLSLPLLAALVFAVGFCTWTLFALDGSATLGLDLDFLCRVVSMDPKGPGHEAGVRLGDRVVAVDGHPVYFLWEARSVAAPLEVGRDLTLELDRHGRVLAKTVAVGAATFPVRPALVLLACTALALLGLLVLARSPGDACVRLYVLTVSAAMVWLTVHMVYARFHFAAFLPAALFSVGLAAGHAFLPVWTHFSSWFTKSDPSMQRPRRGLLVFLYGPMAVFVALHLTIGILFVAAHLRGGPGSSAAFLETVGPFAKLSLVPAAFFNLLLVLFSLFLYARAHAEPGKPERRFRIRLVLLGVMLTAWVAFCYLLLLALIGHAGTGSRMAQVLHEMREALFPLSVLFLLLLSWVPLAQLHTGRLDAGLTRSLAYTMTAALFLILFVGFLHAVSLMTGGPSGWSGETANLVFLLVLVLGFHPVRLRFASLLDRVFQRHRWRLSDALRAIQDVVPTEDLDLLCEHLVDRIAAVLPSERVLLLLRDAEGGGYEMRAARTDQNEEALSDPGRAAPCDALHRMREPLHNGTMGLRPRSGKGHEALKSWMKGLQLEVLVPLGRGEPHEGVLGLGRVFTERIGGDEPGALSALGDACAMRIRESRFLRRMRGLEESLERQAEVNEALKGEVRMVRRSAGKEGRRAGVRPESTCPPVELVGRSEGFRRVMHAVGEVAPTEAAVLIQGETGTGKDLVARQIHLSSPRRRGPFVAVNCSAIPDGLLESELFGHEKGAFTGAVDQRIGKFELANGGTLFLDEIGDMPFAMQAKILRAIEQGEFERVGGTRPIRVDVRIVSATHRDLEEAVRNRTFRHDLYYRLQVVPIQMPPLRQRRGDIPLLARFFLRNYATRMGKEVPDFTEETLERIKALPWRGNVRELANQVERAVVLYRSGEIVLPGTNGTRDPQAGSTEDPFPMGDLRTAVSEYKKKLLLQALQRTHGNKSQAAELLGLNYTSIYRLMKQFGLGEGT